MSTLTMNGRSLDPISLNDLPTELLINIISNIDVHQSNRILGHIPDDPPPSLPDPYLIRDFLTGCRPFCSLSLTSRRFRDLAQKHLFFAPVISGFVFRFPPDRSHSRITYFLRTLLARPDLRKHVKEIRLCFPKDGETIEQRDEKEESNMTAKALPFVTAIVLPCRKLIATLDLPADMKKSWSAQMIMEYRYTMMGIVLVLLPQLQKLSISENSEDKSHYTDNHVLNILGMHPQSHANIDLGSIKCLPVIRSLRLLKLSSPTPVRLDGLDVFPNLDTLDMSLKLADMGIHQVHHLSRLYHDPQPIATLRSIRHLRIDCQTKSVGIWDFSARSGLMHILHGFRQLSSLELYAEPSAEKNPFKSVRAFPHYQTHIQTYPDAPSADYDATTGEESWDERVYAARTEWTDYQYLVDSLLHIRPQLERLQLPGGFWTLPGAARKPLPRFERFPRLQVLVLPQAAVISIKLECMRHQGTTHGDFDLIPTQVLPPNLRHLEIFDADDQLLRSEWLQVLFKEQAACNRWPELRKLEISFGPTFNDKEYADLVTRKSSTPFWTLVDKATFQIEFGRDSEVPMVRA
ncbi:hypothetical protein BDU57DRAFT_546069 [Ampelomyces quisqualis]|uniref:F-box domain-containing protein n=1 Tax=Ampelomyces quisqualis TaxID=50730 RepID=A0A6A5QXV7_AMPQU|nr:hypothetical protein BDU57DRAFT_546069 [Ampelomyces quisqualis]